MKNIAEIKNETIKAEVNAVINYLSCNYSNLQDIKNQFVVTNILATSYVDKFIKNNPFNINSDAEFYCAKVGKTASCNEYYVTVTLKTSTIRITAEVNLDKNEINISIYYSVDGSTERYNVIVPFLSNEVIPTQEEKKEIAFKQFQKIHPNAYDTKYKGLVAAYYKIKWLNQEQAKFNNNNNIISQSDLGEKFSCGLTTTKKYISILKALKLITVTPLTSNKKGKMKYEINEEQDVDFHYNISILKTMKERKNWINDFFSKGLKLYEAAKKTKKEDVPTEEEAITNNDIVLEETQIEEKLEKVKYAAASTTAQEDKVTYNISSLGEFNGDDDLDDLFSSSDVSEEEETDTVLNIEVTQEVNTTSIEEDNENEEEIIEQQEVKDVYMELLFDEELTAEEKIVKIQLKENQHIKTINNRVLNGYVRAIKGDKYKIGYINEANQSITALNDSNQEDENYSSLLNTANLFINIFNNDFILYKILIPTIK